MGYLTLASRRLLGTPALLLEGRRWMLKYCIDLGLWMLAIPLAFVLRLESNWLSFPGGLALLILASLLINAVLIYWTGLYRRSWHRLGLRDLLALGFGIGAAVAVLEIVTLLGLIDAPRSIPFIAGMLALLATGGTRVAARLVFEKSGRLAASRNGKAKNVLIAGAGDAGVMIAREMMRNFDANLLPIGFVDDAPYKQNQRLLGLEVLGPLSSLPELVLERDVDEVLIAMPSQRGEVVRRVVELARVARVKHRTMPGMYELISGKVSISQIREVDYEDLLKREPVRLEMNRIASYVDDQVVLVTGAGGSIGSELVRQLVRFEPAEIVLLERSEANLYAIDIELRDRFPEIRRTAVAGDVCDPDTLEDVFSKYHPNVVFHAAAYKHVPLMEEHPWAAVLNNVGGTRNLAGFALEYAAERFVNISTDKAVNPTSMMGASKRLAEMVVCAASRRTDPLQSFVSVRFGNVLGSNGSVVPLFKKQIRQGGPVTVTHPEMTRYFMTIPEASQLVLQAGSTAENGHVYVLDMGEPVKIVDLAKDLILLSGLRVGEDIDIAYTGTRPGEKLYEEILTEEEGTAASSHEKIFVAKNQSLPESELNEALERLFKAARRRDEGELRSLVAKLIPANSFSEGDGRHGGVSHHWAARVS